MDTTMMLLLMMACVIAICFLLISNEKKQNTKHEKRLLKAFSEMASAKGLRFTSQEIIRNNIIGLDAERRQLLILDSSLTPLREVHINLLEVNRCLAKHHFSRAYEPHPEKIERVECCSLVFDFVNGATEEVKFENVDDHITELRDTSQKISKWAQLISQLLTAKQDQDSPSEIRRAS